MGYRKAALIQRKPSAEPRSAAARSAAPAALRPRRAAFSNRASIALVQAKLAAPAAGNAYEQEADRAAEQLLRSRRGPVRVRPVSPDAWRGGVEVPPEVGRRIQWMRGRGSPLSPAIRRQFEARMQRSLASVRIHTSSEAAELAALLEARAFAAGQDVFFGAGEFQPNTQGGRRLLAHELAHTVQQSQGIAGPGVQREEKGESVKDWLERKAGEGLALVGDAAMAAVRRYAPGLAKIIDASPFEYLKGEVSKAIEAWVPDLVKEFSIESVLGKVRAGMGSLFDKLKSLRNPSAQACKKFADTLGAIRDFITGFIDNPVFEFFREGLEKFQASMAKVSAFVLAPVFDFFRDQAVATWTAVKKVAGWIWSGIKAVKDFAGSALDWVLQRLGIDTGDSEGGVWAWVKRQADKIWTAIREKLAPIIGPWKTMIKIGLALTPLGPIYLLIRYGPEVVKSIQWLWEHRNDPKLLENAKEMGGTILPGLADAITNGDAKLDSLVTWLTTHFGEMGKAVLHFLEKVTGLPLVGPLRAVIDKVSEELQKTIAWARDVMTKGAEAFRKAVDNLKRIIEPYKRILSSVALAVVNPAMIPIIIAGWAWRAIPHCFKIPIIDFVLDIVIKALAKLPTLLIMGPLWPLLKSAVIASLETVRKQDEDTKEALSNKFALIISGASPDFLIGFVKGFLTGAWETVSDPIKAIWSIIEGLNKLLELFDKWTGGGETQVLHRVDRAVALNAAPGAEGAPAAAAQPAAAAVAVGAPAPAPPATAGPAPAAVSAAPDARSGAPESEEEPAPAGGEEAVRIGPEDQTALGERFGQMGKEIKPHAAVVTGQFWGAAEEYFNASGGTSFPQLIAKLGDAWDAVQKKIQSESRELTKKLIDYLISNAADGEIGDKLGWLTGMVATQLLLDFLTAGTTEVLKPLQAVAKFLNWPMELMGKAFKLIGKLGKYVVSWIKKMGAMVKDAAAGAFLAVKDALGAIGSKLIKFAEEIIGRFSKFGGKRAGAAVREGEKLAESGAAKVAGQEGKALAKVEGKGLKQAEKKAGGELSEKAEAQELKAEQEAQEAQKKSKKAKEESERKAREKLEAPVVVQEAKRIVAAGNRLHTPLPAIMAELWVLKAAHSWIDYFRALPGSAPGRVDIHLVASDYDLGEVDVATPPRKARKPLNDRGLTEEQEKYFRDLIDNPPAGIRKDRIRYERNRLARRQRNLKPEYSETDWQVLKDRLEKNRQFGVEQENKARKGLAKHENRPNLKNNNAEDPIELTTRGSKKQEITTRPDSIDKNGAGKIDFVHDHKTVTGSEKVVYDTEQLKAQRKMLETAKGEHVVTISTKKPKLTKIPPEPRPSTRLAGRSKVYYTNPKGEVTHVWVVEETMVPAGGFWSRL